MADIAALKVANAIRWGRAKPTRNFDSVAKRLIAPEAKAAYQEVEAVTGVPWEIVAVIHEREASQSWAANIAQGDRWDRVSVRVPAGRGPFKSWKDAAVDALTDCAPHAAHNKDWSPGGALTLLEQYNGLAYAGHGEPSPYIWSGTDQYKIGKVMVDHGPIEPVVDVQLGCAGLLMAMIELDSSISFGAKPSASNSQQPPAPSIPRHDPPPSITNPAKGSIGDFFASILAAIFAFFKKK